MSSFGIQPKKASPLLMVNRPLAYTKKTPGGHYIDADFSLSNIIMT